jgi:hypothetical protein
LFGGQKAVWYGGIIIMCGHIILAVPHEYSFFIGLIFVATGTGLLKPNISAMVGQLYTDEDERRDGGFAIYYMGINLGSLIGYYVCGYFMENVGWHWAFGAAAVGMGIGLIQYKRTLKNLPDHSALPANPLSPKGTSRAWGGIAAFVIATAGVTAAAMTGAIVINPSIVAGYTAVIFTVIFFVYFGLIYFKGKLTDAEKQGFEGIMLRKNSSYEGKRSKNLLKVKKFFDEEYIVKRCDLGDMRFVENGKEVVKDVLRNIIIEHKGYDVGVGSGFSKQQREHYFKNPNELLGKTVTIQYFEETQNQMGGLSLRFPVIKHIYENGRDC